MLTKLLFLLLYFVFLFATLRILELAAWYESGFLACHLVDPLSLSVKKLKTLLDERGISYNGVFEKQELSELVSTSGELTESESLSVTSSQDERSSESTRFTCGAHFNEEVEDKKDSVWIVQVIPERKTSYLTDKSWSMLVKKISRFGIRTGIFDCTLDSRFCKRKGWEKSNVIIALPLGQQPKDNVAIITYDGPSKLQPLLDWINYRLSSRIEIISSERELKTQWIEQTALNKIILVSHMNKSPMFFSALSVKFSGRFKFGKYTLKDEDYESFQQNTGIKKFPSFLIVMPESTFEYGERDGEFQTYKSMEIFLKSFHPEINDVFLMSLVLVNIICFMDVFLVNSTLARRSLKLFWQLGKYNVVTIILWIPLLRIVQLNCMENVCKFGYKVMRLVSQTELACCIRRDWIIYGGYTTLLVISFLMYGIAVSNIRKIFGFSQPSADDNMNISEWWNQTMQQCYHLLIRTSPTFRTRGPNDVHLMENGLDLLIERLAVPDLWLNPLVSNDYICDLPVWSYAGMMCQKYNEAKTASVCRCSVQQLKINNGNEKETSKGPCCHSNCIMQPEDRDEKKETEQCVHNLDCDHTDMKESNDPNSHDAQQPQPPEGMIISQECAICLESYDTESILCGLPCYHTYHHQCIVVWLHGHHCCPICRWPSYKSKGFKCPEHMD